MQTMSTVSIASLSLVWLSGMIAGCAAEPAWPKPEQAADLATAVEGAIVVELQGEPTDIPALGNDQLTWATAIRETLLHSPKVQMMLARVRLAQAQGYQARLLPNPVVSVVLRWPEGGGSPIVEAGLAAELLALLRKPAEAQAADQRLRASSADAVVIVLDVLAEAQSTYTKAQSLDALIPILEERRALLDRLVDQAQRRLDAGEGIRLDVTTLEAQRVELDVQIAEHGLEQRDARLALGRLMGRPSSAATWTLEASSPATDTDIEADESSWIRAALAHRPEIESRVLELAALGVDARLAQWAPWDALDAGVDAERDGTWSVGPSISTPIPLLDWGQAKRAAAEARKLEVMHELTGVRRQVVEEVRRAHASVMRLQNICSQVRDRLLPLLQRRLSEADAAFTAGQSGVTPLILADQELQAGRARLIELERARAEAWIRLMRAAGGPGHAPSPAKGDGAE